MRIIDVTINFFAGNAVSKTFLFEDDKSIDIDIDTNEVCDADGFYIAPESRLKTIEDRMNIKIKR